MNKSTYLSYLLALIKTKAYAEEVIEKIDELKESLYNKRIDLDKKMNELFSFEMKEKIRSYSWQEQVNLNDPESFGKFLLNLRSHIKNMPIVTFRIAFKPNGEIVDEVSGWFVENYGKNILLDFVYDKSLIGGAVIIFNQKSRDFSLKKRLEERYKVEDWEKFVTRVRVKNMPAKTPQLNGETIKQVVQVA
ncbi:hypothetical protein A3A46_01745 [Candidatus Roizmanbacteria bacterium RIFCSPLOWO2_01_FULL_37_13]|uniref:Uncharacterized protein n=1 Tax=Candidatus Roizmanbacteria bacterium RIFCSPHIGHO2_02_FULL_38_11 TaxID=1802039 RepID=A0A1F7H1R4_9BACT|nr:MAG: hypothetical protein A3C25_01405 [Candidatus Roizmanbacteria bacterium RIFCSPHIGHO2_02_FULL_38_11]OGK41981.1 MAG: hypothetical protein A3A46_01745 [Candidatus Roizmanbacteria bacterium RIFCSPLOWO2_01_FULL_37_13]